jgi:predicted RNase H-like HicB family nuclease
MGHIVLSAELVREEKGGYTVYCPELDIYTQGDDIEDALNNLSEAARLHIEEVGVENLKLRQVERREIEMAV